MNVVRTCFIEEESALRSWAEEASPTLILGARRSRPGVPLSPLDVPESAVSLRLAIVLWRHALPPGHRWARMCAHTHTVYPEQRGSARRLARCTRWIRCGRRCLAVEACLSRHAGADPGPSARQRASHASAIAALQSVPARILSIFMLRRPLSRIAPKPPALMVAAMVAMPTVEMEARRTPAMMAGRARGEPHIEQDPASR